MRVPQVRFKGFSDEWEEKELGLSIASIIGGGTPNTSILSYWNGNINWYAPTEIGSSIFVDNSEKKITELGLQKSSAQMLPAHNTILFTSRAGIGNMAILSKDACTNQGFQSLVIKNDHDVYFIFSCGHLIKNFAEKNASGSTFLEISGKKLGKMQLSVPCGSEQTKIGNFFKDIDKVIALEEQKYTKLMQMKKALLEKMFPKENAQVPEIRFHGFCEDWEKKRLYELASFSKGQGYSKGDLQHSGTPIILYGRLYTKYQTEISNVDTFVHAKAKSIYSEGGEVIVPASGETAEDISVASVVKNANVLLGGDLNIINPSSELYPVFLALTITYGYTHRELSKRAQGKSVVHLRNDDLALSPLKLPSHPEQTKIGKLFKTLDKRLTLQQAKIEKLQNVKKALLEKMFV